MWQPEVNSGLNPDPVSLALPHRLVRDLQGHASSAYPFECCGVLVGVHGDGAMRADRIVRSVNVAEGDRRTNYQIDWTTLFRVTRQTRDTGESIVGFYHSHPDGTARPSKRDAAAAWLGMLYVIVPVWNDAAGTPTAWRMTAAAPAFVEVPFLWNRHGPRPHRLLRNGLSSRRD